jgi:hypothetical protein
MRLRPANRPARCLFVLMNVLAFVAAMSLRISVDAQTKPGHTATLPWTALEHKHAWILLGYLEADKHKWIVGGDDFLVTKQASPEVALPYPRKGDQIELKQTRYMVVLAYGTEREKHVWESPLERERLEPEDYVTTGGPNEQKKCVLEIGSKLTVDDIRIGEPKDGRRRVWAFVTPTPDNRTLPQD